MKLRLFLMLAVAMITLTSMSQCSGTMKDSLDNMFDPLYYCPVNAKINGEDYASKEYMRMSESFSYFTDFTVESNVYWLNTGTRKLMSKSGPSLYIAFKLGEKIEYPLEFGKRYRPKIYLSDGLLAKPSTTDGWITIESYEKNLECKFQCVVRDTLTNEVIYDVKDGYFSLPYLGTLHPYKDNQDGNLPN